MAKPPVGLHTQQQFPEAAKATWVFDKTTAGSACQAPFNVQTVDIYRAGFGWSLEVMSLSSNVENSSTSTIIRHAS